MATPEEARKELQRQEKLRSSFKKQWQGRTAGVISCCCCCSAFLVLAIWTSSRISFHLLTGHVSAVLLPPSLNDPGFNEEEFRNSLWDYNDSEQLPALQYDLRTTTTTTTTAPRGLPEDEKYMWYSPHSGFSSQARELMSALKIAFLLNRTLVLPPVLDHFEVKDGTCLGPLRDQRALRKLSRAAIFKRFDSSRSTQEYVSIADIIDLNSIKTRVKTIDLRVFLALWCGIDISPTCHGPICHTLARDLSTNLQASISSCEAKLFPTPEENKSGLQPIHEVDDGCRTTIWTNGESQSEKTFLEERLTTQLHNDKSLPPNVNASSLHIKRKDVIQTLGPTSPAGSSFLLTFGNLFSKHYNDRTLTVDISGSTPDENMAPTLTAIERQPFSVDILDAGQDFVQENMMDPFFCAQVRLGDGMFMSDQENRIFRNFRQKLEHLELKRRPTKRNPLNVFVMTDLPQKKWPGTYLHDINVNPKYKIYTMDDERDLLIDVATRINLHEYGLIHGFLPELTTERREMQSRRLKNTGVEEKRTPNKFPRSMHLSDIRHFIEEVVCSCATSGFQGTTSSTITRNILNLRKSQMCPIP